MPDSDLACLQLPVFAGLRRRRAAGRGEGRESQQGADRTAAEVPGPLQDRAGRLPRRPAVPAPRAHQRHAGLPLSQIIRPK